MKLMAERVYGEPKGHSLFSILECQNNQCMWCSRNLSNNYDVCMCGIRKKTTHSATIKRICPQEVPLEKLLILESAIPQMNCLWTFILNSLLVGIIQTDSLTIISVTRPNPYEQVPIPIPHSLFISLNCCKFATN